MGQTTETIMGRRNTFSSSAAAAHCNTLLPLCLPLVVCFVFSTRSEWESMLRPSSCRLVPNKELSFKELKARD